jgi:hypothetical protein
LPQKNGQRQSRELEDWRFGRYASMKSARRLTNRFSYECFQLGALRQETNPSSPHAVKNF